MPETGMEAEVRQRRQKQATGCQIGLHQGAFGGLGRMPNRERVLAALSIQFDRLTLESCTRNRAPAESKALSRPQPTCPQGRDDTFRNAAPMATHQHLAIRCVADRKARI